MLACSKHRQEFITTGENITWSSDLLAHISESRICGNSTADRMLQGSQDGRNGLPNAFLLIY